MCGIVGVVGASVEVSADPLGLLRTAADSLEHRGPDGAGAWVAPHAPVAFGHRRLAVIDIAESAAQPMVVEGDHISAITFNGEIYNFAAIRARLVAHGVEFRTGSDTEVLLQLCRIEGVEKAIEQLRGMFAFAYFDERDGAMWLVRDRFGEKPLYVTLQRGTVAFASELRALRTFDLDLEVDPCAVDQLMRRSCVGGATSIYRGVHKLVPGTAMRVEVGPLVTEDMVRTVTYWDPLDRAAAAAEHPFRGDLDQAADRLDELLGNSVVSATVSDVPLGAFLSGGIDSTSVVSQLARRAQGVTKTFTIGFTSEYHSEADEARRIAKHLGTHHTDLTITSDELQAVIPRLPNLFDEPFADSSQIPTFLVSQLARRDVTVALTGDGGDELFCGYPRFRSASRGFGATSRIPAAPRRAIARRLGEVERASWDRVGAAMAGGMLRRYSGGLADRADKAASLLASEHLDEVYRLFNTSFWDRSIVPGVACSPNGAIPPGPSPEQRLMLYDTITYLPDDILTKVDRAAMAVSLETRVPFLTPELFEFAHSLPVAHLVDGKEQKLILRHLLDRHVPKALWDHPKRGFSIPLGSWLRGPLRSWAEDLLTPDALGRHGLLDAQIVRELWTEHCDGRRNWGSQLWNVLMFQSWYDCHHVASATT